MSALKTYLPSLAADFGKSTEQLNELLREMVRQRLVKVRLGRGPGSGVEMTPRSISVLLLALLSSDIRSEAVQRAKAIATAKPVRYRWCPFTQTKNLGDAIAAGLQRDGVQDGEVFHIQQIQLYRGVGTVRVVWASKSSAAESKVVGYSLVREFPHDDFSVTATLHHRILSKIAADLRALNELTPLQSRGAT